MHHLCITCTTSSTSHTQANTGTLTAPKWGHEWEAHGDVRYPPARAAHGSDPSIRAGPRYQLALWAAGAGEKEPPVCVASERRANHISERRSEQPACPSCAAFPKLEASTAPPSTPLYLSSRSIFLAPLQQDSLAQGLPGQGGAKAPVARHQRRRRHEDDRSERRAPRISPSFAALPPEFTY